MASTAIRFAGLLCLGIAAGIAVCVFLADRVWGTSGPFYTEVMQVFVRVLTVPAPLLGGVALFAMVIDAAIVFRQGVGAPLWLLFGAIALSLAALVLTRFGHFPINDRIMTWDPANPPADWSMVQAQWSAFHAARTSAAVGSFALLVLSTLLRRRA